MIEIKDLLARFDHILNKEAGKKEIIREAISSVIGVEISTKDISIKNNTIYLNLKPIYKNEIFLKQEKIFSKMNEALGKKTPDAIR
jgi:hypothetical protein